MVLKPLIFVAKLPMYGKPAAVVGDTLYNALLCALLLLYQFTVEHFCHLVVAYVVSGYGVPPSLWQNSATTCKNVVVSGISYCMVDHPITFQLNLQTPLKENSVYDSVFSKPFG